MKKHAWTIYIALLITSVAFPAAALYDWNRPGKLAYAIAGQDDPSVVLEVRECSFKGKKIHWRGSAFLDGYDASLKIFAAIRNKRGEYIPMPKTSQARPDINEAHGRQTWFDKYGFDAAIHLPHKRQDYLDTLYIVLVTENGETHRRGYECEDI